MRLKTLLLIPSVALILPLGACDGLEFQSVDNMFPYGNKRTAGSGTAYVLAKMLPKKEMKLEAKTKVKPVERKMEAKPAEKEVLNDMREMFREKQRK